MSVTTCVTCKDGLVRRGDNAWCAYDGGLICVECEIYGHKTVAGIAYVACLMCLQFRGEHGAEPDHLDLCERCGEPLNINHSTVLCVACTCLMGLENGRLFSK